MSTGSDADPDGRPRGGRDGGQDSGRDGGQDSERDGERERELGDFLRSRRAAIDPADVGLPSGPRRRAPGLRREEVALLAGVSVTWYTWLEQGRPINASVDVLEALARSLRLDDAERHHLLTLATRVPGEPVPDVEDAPDALVRLIDSMQPAPAYVLGPRWEYLAWNRAQSLLYPMIEQLAPADRNLLWVVFAEPTARELMADWPEQARRILAEFRAGTAGLRTDQKVVALVERLRTASPEFADRASFHKKKIRHSSLDERHGAGRTIKTGPIRPRER